jgi:molybdopterin molybdotransferase
MVCFHLFVVPGLRTWAGFYATAAGDATAGPERRLFPALSPHLPQAVAVTQDVVKPDSERIEYHRCVVSFEGGRLVARSTGQQASHRLMSMAGANGLLIVPAGVTPVPKGTALPVVLIGPL